MSYDDIVVTKSGKDCIVVTDSGGHQALWVIINKHMVYHGEGGSGLLPHDSRPFIP